MIRRARSLIATWDDGRFCLENYLTGARTIVAVPVVQVLDELDEYTDIDEFLRRLDTPALDELLDTLRDRDLIVTEGSAIARKDELLESTWPWRHDARYLHFATNALDFVSDPGEQLDYLLRRAAETPPPSPYRDYGRPGTALPRRHADRSGDLWRVLHSRRTRRTFTGAAISRNDFADILLWTWGRSRHLSFPRTGDFVIKTSPSGGARHPVEVYPAVLAVEDVEPGIYHYSVRDNSIVPLRTGHIADLAVELCAGHEWIRSAAAVFFMTAVVERSAWKYPNSHAYRVLHLDAGHLGQTFHLVCTELGLGPFTFAATRNPAVEDVLGIDGITEIVLYTAAVGVPAPGAAGRDSGF